MIVFSTFIVHNVKVGTNVRNTPLASAFAKIGGDWNLVCLLAIHVAWIAGVILDIGYSYYSTNIKSIKSSVSEIK